MQLHAGPNLGVSEDIRRHPAVFQLFCKSSRGRSKRAKEGRRFRTAGLGAECQRDRALATLLARRVFKSTDRPTRHLAKMSVHRSAVAWMANDRYCWSHAAWRVLDERCSWHRLRHNDIASIAIKAEGKDQPWPLFCRHCLMWVHSSQMWRFDVTPAS